MVMGPRASVSVSGAREARPRLRRLAAAETRRTVARSWPLLALCLPLLTSALGAQAPVIQVVTDERHEQAAADEGQGYAAYPVTLLSVLGAQITPAHGQIEVILFGDTLVFRTGRSIFTVNRRMEPLYHWVFERDGVLFLPARFFFDWLPRRYPQRVRADAEAGLISVAAPWARHLVMARRQSNGSAPPPADPTRRSASPGAAADTREPPDDHLGAGVRPGPPPLEDPDRIYPGRLIGFIDARVSGVYDDNIGHSRVPRPSHGTIGRLAAGIQSAPYYPFLRAHYDFAAYRFDEIGWWNRATHDVTVELAPRVRAVRFRVAAQLRVGSSTEDREQADQFIVMPRVDMRLGGASELSLYGAQVKRRFPDNPARDDTYRYAGVAFAYGRWSSSRWELSTRYALNEPERAASRLEQWTVRGAAWFWLTNSDHLSLGLTHHRRWYEEQMGQLGDGTEGLRRDRRWTPAVSLGHTFGGRQWSVRIDYQMDLNESNVVARSYGARRVELTLRRRW